MFTIVFIDDILVYSEEHEEYLKRVVDNSKSQC